MGTWRELLEDATNALKDEMEYNPGAEPDFYELADSVTPVYYRELLEVATDNVNLMLTIPESGASGTPMELITANVFEAIVQHLDETYHQLLEEDEDYDEE